MKNRKVRFEVDRNDQELQRRAPGTSNTKIAPVVKTFKKNEMVVAVRCRPFNNREKDYNDMNVIKIDSGSIVTVMDIMKNEEANRNKVKEQQYAFDYAFDRDASQSTVYESTTQFLLKDVVEGFNATVLAYGATGAGKTYTMVGSPENPGVMVRSLSDIFKYIDAKDQKDFKIKITYVEVYNETIRDLLSDNIEVLEMREDPIKGVSLIGANETFVSSASEVFRCLVKGNKNRMEEATTSNENSSRSHAILQVNIEIKDKTTRLDNEIALGKFILVDLAGSERISGSNNSGIRILESANINKSLLALGVCINSLVDSSNKGGKNFIPWRDSKLTRLLKVNFCLNRIH